MNNMPVQKNKAAFSLLCCLLVGVLLLIWGASALPTNASAAVIVPDSISSQEESQEFTEEEFQNWIDELRAQYEVGFIVTLDLVDPNGIDPELLPDDVAVLVDNGFKVVAYRESKRPEVPLTVSLAPTCNTSTIFADATPGIPCDSTYNLNRDLTVGKVFSGIEQFNRVWAQRYDNYSGCVPNACVGWEYLLQGAKWTRTNSTWSVGASTAKMKSYSDAADNYCTGASVSLNYGSTWFSPTFNGNTTNWWIISKYANIAYVPYPFAVSYTQGDLYQSGILKYDNAQTTQIHNHLP